MVKDLIEDIKRPKRSLQDILPASTRGGPASPSQGGPASPVAPKPPDRLISSEPRERPKRRWPIILLIILVIIIPAVYFASTIFGQATVVITPRRLPLTVSGTYRAVNLPTESASSTVLGFQTMTIRGSDSIAVPAGELVKVSERAKGLIVITNRYSATLQRLIANTRFEATTGKIYRIREAVVVPGYTLVNKTLVPGELTVEVTADQPGSDYNGAPLTFTIPGFKSDARFNTITARGKTPFTGGFVGERKMISASARATAEAELNRRLKERLLAEATSQTPNNYVWYPDSVFWRLDLPDGEADISSGTTTVKLTRQVELVAPIFSRAELSQALARRFVPAYDETSVLLENLEQLNLRPIGPLVDPEHLPEFTFTLEGKGILVWQFDTAALIRDLAGRNARDYQSVFVKYPSIVAAQATFQPSWLINFPADPKRINLSADKAGLTRERPSANIPNAH